MYAGNLPPATAEKLATVGDIVRQEQYMDFMNNRRFRTTLLCRAAVALDRKLTVARLEPFYWRSLLVPETPGEAAGQAPDGSLIFAVPGTSIRLKTDDPVSAAAFQVLSRYRGLPVKPADVVRKVVERHGIADTGKIRSALGGPAARLVFAGGIRLHSQGPTWTAEPSQRPVASPLARHQARSLDWLTNQRHEPVRADAVCRVLVQHLDGRHDRPALAERLIDQLRKGELTLQHEGKQVTDPGELAQRVAAAVDVALGRLAENALLVA
jgi:methyltransferase-like protein